MNWPELLSSLVRGDDQPAEATGWAMGEILKLAGDAGDAMFGEWPQGTRALPLGLKARR